jgi:hypothetical protein
MAFATIDVTKGITGTIPVANGGTGIASGTTGQFLKFTGSTTVASAATPGKIGQVIHTKDTTYRSITTNSFVTCLEVIITPSATSSKILVLNSANITKHNNAWAIERMYRVVGGSDVATQVLTDVSGYTNTTTANNIGFSATQFYDTPSSTAAITYSYRIASGNNNSSVEINNYASAGSFSSQMTAMEILA